MVDYAVVDKCEAECAGGVASCATHQIELHAN